MAVRVTVKWGKQKFDNVELNTAEAPLAFKAALFALTGVPPDRQKLMGKSGLVKDDAWTGAPVANGATFMLVGSADEPPVAPPPVADKEVLPDAPAEGKELAVPTPPGLVNLSNTCYLNSTLQVLHAVPELAVALKAPPAPAQPGAPAQAGQLANSLRDLFTQLDRVNDQSVGPLAFVQLFRAAFPQFAERGKDSNSFAMQDAEEAWSTIMNTLSARLPALGGPAPAAAGGAPAAAAVANAVAFRSAVDQLFSGELATAYKCIEEGADAVMSAPKKESFLKLSCNIGNNTNFLYDGLKDSLVEDVSKRSEKLGRDAVHKKQSHIARLPYYLTVQFVRFFWRKDKDVKVKILRPVEFPLVIDLYDFCSDELKAKLAPARKALQDAEEERIKTLKPEDKKKARPEPTRAPEDVARPEAWHNETGRYELCGVVSHRGRSADGGHYVGYVKQARDKWLLFDDETVSYVKKLSGKGGADAHIAYVLLYRSVKGL